MIFLRNNCPNFGFRRKKKMDERKGGRWRKEGKGEGKQPKYKFLVSHWHCQNTQIFSPMRIESNPLTARLCRACVVLVSPISPDPRSWWPPETTRPSCICACSVGYTVIANATESDLYANLRRSQIVRVAPPVDAGDQRLGHVTFGIFLLPVSVGWDSRRPLYNRKVKCCGEMQLHTSIGYSTQSSTKQNV